MHTKLTIPLCFFCLTLRAAAIGNHTHAEISERAADRYCSGPQAMVPGLSEFMTTPAIRKALFSGSTFPDWGYGDVYPDAAEQAHWTPFHKTFFMVLKEKLPAQWTEEDAKNVAFFLGDVSHSVADIPWHFDGPGCRSFISASGDAQKSSHIDCDTGSDVFLVQQEHENVVPPIGFNDFYWPEALVTEVYHRDGRAIDPAIVHTGHIRQQGLWLIMDQYSAMQYPDFKTRCTWIGSNFQSYYYGGVDHDAAAVAIWFKYYFARLRGDYFFQAMPKYGPTPPGWDGYYGVTDTTIYADAPANNAGSEPQLELQPGGKSTAILRFDLAEIPRDAAIASATLWLAPAEGTTAPATLNLGPCPHPWEPGATKTDDVTGALGATTELPGLTWAKADGLTGVATLPAPLSSAAPGWVTLDLTAQVRAWTNAPDTNHGLALQLRPDATAPLRLYSADAWKSPAGGERVAFRPALMVTLQH